MSQARSNFDEKKEVARGYEKALASWYQRKFGAHVLPTYDYSGLQDDKAPRLIGIDDGIVIPDLLVCCDGKTVWVECKWKSHADFNRKRQIRVTGISARHYEHYTRVKLISGCRVMLMFLHIAEEEMRGGEIDSLPAISHRYDGLKMGRGGMIFWDYDLLKRWCNLNEILGQKK
jgi:hypothetical protein